MRYDWRFAKNSLAPWVSSWLCAFTCWASGNHGQAAALGAKVAALTPNSARDAPNDTG